MPTVIVEGLAEIQRDLAKSGGLVETGLQAGLIHAAEPVAHTAEVLSMANIRRMPHSPQWAKTRIGVKRKFVYIVPKERGARGRDNPRARPFGETKTGGPTFGDLVLGRSFEPALDVMTPIVQSRVEIALEGVLRPSLAFAA